MNRIKFVWLGALVLVLVMGTWFVSQNPTPRAEAPRVAPTESEAERVSEIAPLATERTQKDTSTARDVVDVAAEIETDAAEAHAVEPIAPELWRWQARLRLLDGTPVPRAHYAALVEGTSAAVARTASSKVPQPPEILARGSIADDGLLELDLPASEIALGGADLYRLSQGRLEPDPQRIDFDGPQPAELVYEGGSIDVHVLDVEGAPVKSARVVARWAELAPGGAAWRPTYTSVTDESGRARIVFVESGVGEIVAIGNNGSALARLREMQFEPSSVDDGVTLVLGQEGLTGRLRVELTSAAGTPVRNFALRITSESLPEFHRFVDSRSIGPEGIVDGLPPGLATIGVSRVYREPPSLLRDEGIAPRNVELHADRIAEFRAVVPLAARWRLHVVAEEESLGALEVHARRTDQGDGEWKHERNVWQFDPTDGATTSLYLSAPGVHYSHEMDPGVYDIELRGLAGGEVLWRSSVTLLEGEITPLSVRL